jgi:serine/threonine-protein kinase
MEEFQWPTSALIAVAFIVLILVAAVVGGVFFARRNLRLGRGDRRNATRLAFFVSSLIMISWILGAHHVLTESEFGNFLTFAGLSLLGGGLLWILYIALEPFVRRRWPQILVSWTRLLSGDLRDPLVARDALIGCALGTLLFFLRRFSRFLFPSWGGSMEFNSIPTFAFSSAMGIGSFVSYLLLLLIVAICVSLLGIFLLFLLRILLRNQKAAIAAWILLWSMISLNSPWLFALSLVSSALVLLVLMRFGLVAYAFYFFAVLFFSIFPATLDASAWYSHASFAAFAIFAAIVLYAFRYSLGGRPLISAPHLDD